MIIFTLILAALSKFLSPILGIGTVQNFPPALSQEDEREKFIIMREDGERGEDARQELILHNLRLVAHIVRKYYSQNKNTILFYSILLSIFSITQIYHFINNL